MKYRDIINACCLNDDLRILPNGDLTEIGEKGVNLSGGQKQRVRLAREVYQDADIYIFDDPLSALDSHVGKNVFKNVIGPNGLLKNKTRILVTHNLCVLPEVDQIIVMKNGKIEEMGTYQYLLDSKKYFFKFIQEHLRNPSMEEYNGELESELHLKKTCEVENGVVSQNLSSLTSKTVSDPMNVSPEEKNILNKNMKFIEKENMETGEVKFKTFWSYFQNASLSMVILVILAWIINQSLQIGSNIWLKNWTTDSNNDTQTETWRLTIYGGTVISQGIAFFVMFFLMTIAVARASKNLHRNMLKSIMGCNLAFFERTPIGRILNRFGKDLNIVDGPLQRVLICSLNTFGIVISSWIVLSALNVYIFLASFPCIIIWIFFQRFSTMACQKLRRLYSVMNSPIMSNFSETVQGLPTIRAQKAQAPFISKHENLTDNSFRAGLSDQMIERWIYIRLGLFGSLVIFMASIFIVVRRDEIDGGTAGLVLTYALVMCSYCLFSLKACIFLKTGMVSVERIDEYSILPQEAPGLQNSVETLKNKFPSQGQIVFEDYQMKYQKSKTPVLKGIHTTIFPKQKVGIVGRTGAGKSSLVLGLSRIEEALSGRILIDGTDISTISLHQLRSSLTIIPQDPVLFSGSLRMNLDPFEEYSDLQLWNALERAHLKPFIEALTSGLDYAITEGGQNLSVGQRQQICLVRALLKKTKILILDEATAAMDLTTDQLIQEVIRLEFRESTVLTIAHRLYTVLDYDRIIVMDEGQIVEDGNPNDLLKDQRSLFCKLAKDCGLH